MDISGLIQGYDSRATSSAALTRAIMAPQYATAHAFSGPNSNTNMVATQMQHNPFSFGAYTGPGSNGLIPAFANNFIQQRPLPRLIQTDDRNMSFARTTRQGYIEEHHSQSPPIKNEPLWTVPNTPSFTTKTITSPIPGNEVVFGTEVDTLMKAIQAKSKTPTPQPSSTAEQTRTVVGASRTPPYRQPVPQSGGYASSPVHSMSEREYKLTQPGTQDDGSSKGGKKRYQCTIENCTKSFYQKTHLDIHERAHTGVKPYPCKEPGCGRSFSQLGNLKTHERRHTGERPYQCEICGKRFAQRGNVRAHKIVHDQSKPYLCRLDECGKQFTQLGNLKSHQNKFHISTIRSLTQKFASIKDGDIVHAADKELWEYFANLYKNSNKGIKGRGKDRKVGSNGMRSHSLNSLSGSTTSAAGSGYMSSTSRSNTINLGNGNILPTAHNSNNHNHTHAHNHSHRDYEMFDVDESSQHSGHSSMSGSGGASSVGTCYDDAPSDGFEEGHGHVVGLGGGRGGDLAFGDRIY